MQEDTRDRPGLLPRFTLRSLEDKVVLDLTRCVGGRFGASVLGQFGLKVLRPTGGLSEVAGAVDPKLEPILGRHVQSVAVEGNAALGVLLEEHSPDVVLLSGPTPSHEDREQLRGEPGLVSVALSPLGLDSVLGDDVQDTTLTVSARSGWLGITGEQDSAPTIIRGYVGEFASGWAVASAALNGLSRRARSGEGSFVDVASVEVFAFLQWMATQRAAFDGGIMQRTGSRAVGHPWGVYPCQDGHVVLIVGGSRRNWERFADLIGAPVLKEPKFASPVGRAQFADEIDAHMMPWLFAHTAEEIYELGQREGLPFGVVREPSELPLDPQLAFREFFQQGEDGHFYPELPITFDGRRLASSVRGGA